MSGYDGRIDSRALEARLAELRKPVTMTEHADKWGEAMGVEGHAWMPGAAMQGFEAGWQAAITAAVHAMEAEQDRALGRDKPFHVTSGWDQGVHRTTGRMASYTYCGLTMRTKGWTANDGEVTCQHCLAEMAAQA